MSREWKPGDVAVNMAHGYRGIFVEDCTRHDAGRQHWHNESGAWDPEYDIRRPLVVLDPTDRQQVERLSSLVEANGGPHFGGRGVDSLIAALREFTNPTPPKPEEPTGLGAVVEDAEGRWWVRVAPAMDGLNYPWHSGIDEADWSDVAAVKVIRDEVTR